VDLEEAAAADRTRREIPAEGGRKVETYRPCVVDVEVDDQAVAHHAPTTEARWLTERCDYAPVMCLRGGGA
jgi:hypothetical protein